MVPPDEAAGAGAGAGSGVLWFIPPMSRSISSWLMVPPDEAAGAGAGSGAGAGAGALGAGAGASSAESPSNPRPDSSSRVRSTDMTLMNSLWSVSSMLSIKRTTTQGPSFTGK